MVLGGSLLCFCLVTLLLFYSCLFIHCSRLGKACQSFKSGVWVGVLVPPPCTDQGIPAYHAGDMPFIYRGL